MNFEDWFLCECPLPIGLEMTEKWIRQFNAGPQSYLLSIRTIDEDRLIGMFTLRKISWISRSLRFGSAIWPPDLWSQGLGSEARRIFLEYAFKQLGFRRIYGSFSDYNIASRKSHEKLGAEVSAQNLDAVYNDGCYHDTFHYTYARERFPGMELAPTAPQPENPQMINPELLKVDFDRLYQDFYGLPPIHDPSREEWLGGNPIFKASSGRVLLLPEFIKRSGDLLFFPASWKSLQPELLSLAIEQGFNQYNLHRLQTCLPETAVACREILISHGFQLEGKLDQICFANGRYFDLLFLSKLQKE